MTAEQVIMSAMVVMAGAIGYLYRMLSQVQDKIEEAMKEEILSIQGHINQLVNQIHEDRKASTERQIMMVQTIGTLVNRQDLREEIKRAIEEVDRRMQGIMR